MPLQATSGTASYDAFGGGAAVEPVYIEQIFQTYLYTGDGSTQTITNGIDLAGKGGLVWTKCRTTALAHSLFDTLRGSTKRINSASTAAEAIDANSLTAFNTSGFNVGSSSPVNGNGDDYASWTFRKQPKFFDVVTYTGNGTTGRQIAHNLGSVPGCMIVKRTDVGGNDWAVYHRGIASPALYLNLTAANNPGDSQYVWGNGSTTVDPTSTVFTVAASGMVNANGGTYVAYLFAHNAGGFGLTGTDNVISCGSYTGTGTAGLSVTLGYEPQWLLVKNASSSIANWVLVDNMRGFSKSSTAALFPNLSEAEITWSPDRVSPNATGFTLDVGADENLNKNGSTLIYIAIRRGPMKVPTSGTSVFSPVAYTGNATDTTRSAGFPVDMLAILRRSNPFGDGDGNPRFMDRLRGGNSTSLISSSSSAEETSTNNTLYLDNSVGFKTTANNAGAPTGYYFNVSTNPYIAECFRRAPSFFDVVCYSGTGANQLVNHNLGVVPELVIFKARNDPSAQNPPWAVQVPNVLGTGYLKLNAIDANSAGFFAGLPTATQLKTRVNSNSAVNASGYNYVAYLFATCAGVSKCGTFTGNGSSQTINCDFTGGARFVMIKATSTTGDWMVADSARGIVSGSDPYLELNNTNAEVTGEDWLDTDSTGFVVNEVSGSNANTNGVTYIYLAIA